MMEEYMVNKSHNNRAAQHINIRPDLTVKTLNPNPKSFYTLIVIHTVVSCNNKATIIFAITSTLSACQSDSVQYSTATRSRANENIEKTSHIFHPIQHHHHHHHTKTN